MANHGVWVHNSMLTGSLCKTGNWGFGMHPEHVQNELPFLPLSGSASIMILISAFDA